MYLDAQSIYAKLLEEGITARKGEARIEFMGVNVRLRDKSAVGNMLQEWLGNWLTHHQIQYRVKDNTQEFPDFLLHETSDDIGLLEVKTFDDESSANFDIANFDAYRHSMLLQPYRLNADYLIFAYRLNDDGVLTIPKIWLKKIWEITGASDRYPLKCQVKKNMIYNIRPITWYSNRTTYKPFTSRSDFVFALHQTIALYTTDLEANEWFEQVKSKYVEQVGHPL